VLQIRIAYFLTAALVIAPFVALAYWSVSLYGEANVADLHLSSPAGAAIEPLARWIIENRYSSAAMSIVTGGLSLAWYYSKVKCREVERAFVRIERPRRRRRW
jgi:hypothetical protein